MAEEIIGKVTDPTNTSMTLQKEDFCIGTINATSQKFIPDEKNIFKKRGVPTVHLLKPNRSIPKVVVVNPLDP